MTDKELAEIEARLEAELATGGWAADDPDLHFDLLRDEMPRLIAEIRRLQAEVRAFRDGLTALGGERANEILRKAHRAGELTCGPEPAEAILAAELEKQGERQRPGRR